MPGRKRPTAEDRVESTRIALRVIALGVDLPDVARELEPLHPKNDTFPGEVLLALAADTLEEGGISREQPVDYEGIRERYLPEQSFRGKAQHHRSHYALRAVTMIRAGLTPNLLDEVSWWDTNDLWIWSLYALVIYVRVAAERTGQSAAEICQRVAARHGIELVGARG
ncbi:MAG: hypothetical protein ACRDY6_11665 [Acidimicrobiia bacterium]